MHILAGTGHGKTQTLQHLIVSDLQRPANEVPSMVILDSQGDMLNTLKRLALFDPMIEGSLARRLLIVDPSDVHFAPALNLFDVLNEGGIVLVNTAKDFMKTEASSMFGCYIIALTFKAAMERAILPHHARRPTFLWIDEASEYFDDNIDSLLIQARKFKLGLIMAHQYLGQLPRGLPASLMTNTSIKLAGGISDRDARMLAPEMRVSPDVLTGMVKERNQTNFAAYVRNVTPQAMKLTIPFGTAEGLPRMPEDHFQILLNASRKRLSLQPVEPKKEAPTTATQPEPTPTIPLPDDDEFWQPY